MKVDVFSRLDVTEMVPDPNVCLVSIWSLIAMAQKEYDNRPINMDGWKDSLRLDFDDVTVSDSTISERTDTGLVVVPFNEHQGEIVMDFFTKNMGSDFVIHCDAGVSRSVAMGAFLRDFYDYDAMFHRIGHDQHRNITVYNILRREWMKRENA